MYIKICMNFTPVLLNLYCLLFLKHNLKENHDTDVKYA